MQELLFPFQNTQPKQHFKMRTVISRYDTFGDGQLLFQIVNKIFWKVLDSV